MRTEKSPLRIACRADSNSWEGSGFPLLYGLILVRRFVDGTAEPRSLMMFPPQAAKTGQSNRVGGGAISQHEIAHDASNQAEYPSYSKYLGSTNLNRTK